MPGSDSSPLTTRYRGHTPCGVKPHLVPAGNPVMMLSGAMRGLQFSGLVPPSDGVWRGARGWS